VTELISSAGLPEARADSRAEAPSPALRRVNRLLAGIFLVYGAVLIERALSRGEIPSWGYLVIPMVSVALLANRGGRFARDWLPVIGGVFAYAMSGQIAQHVGLTVHYRFQIDMERFLFGGYIPTIWLQDHLYHGQTRVLEQAVVALYTSHFVVPLILGFYLWWTRRRVGFRLLMLTLLATSVIGELTFVLAPTAPPWLASEKGYLPPVHHILKSAMTDSGLGAAAGHVGSAGSYNIVAAMPSLHAAWPLVGLLVARHVRANRAVVALLALQLLGVLFAIVYAGEHYFADAIVGWIYALVCWRVILRAFRAGASSRSPHADSPVRIGSSIRPARAGLRRAQHP
jgi:hypothetical protein